MQAPLSIFKISFTIGLVKWDCLGVFSFRHRAGQGVSPSVWGAIFTAPGPAQPSRLWRSLAWPRWYWEPLTGGLVHSWYPRCREGGHGIVGCNDIIPGLSGGCDHGTGRLPGPPADAPAANFELPWRLWLGCFPLPPCK